MVRRCLNEFAPPRQLNRYPPDRLFQKACMSEHLPTNSDVTGANRDLRWPRLVANSLWIVICFAIGSFAIDLITSVWNHKLKTEIFSLRVVWWFAKAIVV